MARKSKSSENQQRAQKAQELYDRAEPGMLATNINGKVGIITDKFVSPGGMHHVWLQYPGSLAISEPMDLIATIEKKPIAVVLFAGGGGVEAGMVDAGIEPILAVEHDPSKPELSEALAASHEVNFPRCKVLRRTVQECAVDNFAGFPQEPDILWASPVCANFSAAKNGKEQPQDIEVAKAVIEAIKKIKPKHFFLENVPAYERSQSWQQIEAILPVIGYRLQSAVVDMSDYGVPQARRRFIAWAYVPSEHASRTRDNHLPLPAKQEKTSWYEAIADLIPDLPESQLLRGQQAQVDEFLETNKPEPLLIDRAGGRSKYRAVSSSKPSNTILRSHFTDGKGANRNKFADIWLPTSTSAQCKDGTVKSASIECMARLQGFPEWYQFPEKVAIAGSIIGYSVPPKFVEQLIKPLTTREFSRNEHEITFDEIAEVAKEMGHPNAMPTLEYNDSPDSDEDRLFELRGFKVGDRVIYDGNNPDWGIVNDALIEKGEIIAFKLVVGWEAIPIVRTDDGTEKFMPWENLKKDEEWLRIEGKKVANIPASNHYTKAPNYPNLGKVLNGAAVPCPTEALPLLSSKDFIKHKDEAFCYKFLKLDQANSVAVGHWEGSQFNVPYESLSVCQLYDDSTGALPQTVAYSTALKALKGSGAGEVFEANDSTDSDKDKLTDQCDESATNSGLRISFGKTYPQLLEGKTVITGYSASEDNGDNLAASANQVQTVETSWGIFQWNEEVLLWVSKEPKKRIDWEGLECLVLSEKGSQQLVIPYGSLPINKDGSKPPVENARFRKPWWIGGEELYAALSLAEIRRDGGTQPREKLDLAHVAVLSEAIEEGAELEPVVVFYDGESYWLADGFHRCKASQDAGWEDIQCIIHQGTRRDAILHSVGANAEHKAAKPRSRADKRRAVTVLLNDPEWSKWSDREIARQCKVTHPFVSNQRKKLTGNITSEDSAPTRTYTTRHGTTATMQTGNIGRTEGASASDNNGTSTPLSDHGNGEINRPANRWYGGKWRIGKWIASHFPEHRIYVEPFGGMWSVGLQKPQSEIEIYNDIHPLATNFWIRLKEDSERLIQDIDAIQWNEETVEWAKEVTTDPFESAVKFYIQCRIAYAGGGTGWSSGYSPKAFDKKENGDHSHLIAIAKRIKNLQIYEEDALDIIREFDSPDTLFYCDPPYLESTRNSHTPYEYEFNLNRHEELIALLSSIQGKAIVSGYPSPEYAMWLSSWHRKDTNGVTTSNKKATECIWVKPIKPAINPDDYAIAFLSNLDSIKTDLLKEARERIDAILQERLVQG